MLESLQTEIDGVTFFNWWLAGSLNLVATASSCTAVVEVLAAWVCFLSHQLGFVESKGKGLRGVLFL